MYKWRCNKDKNGDEVKRLAWQKLRQEAPLKFYNENPSCQSKHETSQSLFSAFKTLQ